ncbi:MAG: hypothetical protein QOK24_137 [Verrucomicrobiota bacterium]|jgi:pimeloyl-ACP methyl ester carboxylesterase
MKVPRLSTSFALSYFFLTAIAAAAESWKDYTEPQYHIIVVKGNGEPFRPVVQRRQRKGEWQYKVKLESFGRTPEEQTKAYKIYLEALAANIRKSKKTELTVFIHGGMNFVSGSVKHAVSLVANNERFQEFREEGLRGFDISSHGYPIFICWDSPPTGYGEQSLWVRAGKTEKYGRSVGRGIYAWASLPFQILADAGRAVTRLPLELFEFGYNDFYSIDQRSFTEYKRMKEETPYLRGESLYKGLPISPTAKKIAVSNVEPIERKPKHLMQDIGTVLLFPVRSVALPLIDGIGVGAWNNMLRHTDTMFDRTNPESRGRHTPVEDAVAKGETGAIAMFLATLRDSPGASTNYKVTLIGHSMGAIVANRIIVSYPEFNYANIVYLAAACSVREFQGCVIPYLLAHKKSRFYGLSLHPRRESGEIAISPRNIPLDVAPRGSLLVWIDNIFGNPPSEDQRRFGVFQTAVLASHNIPPDARPQVTLKCFKFGDDDTREDGIIRSPQHHGDFSRFPYWDPARWQLDPPPSRKSRTAGPDPTRSTAATSE